MEIIVLTTLALSVSLAALSGLFIARYEQLKSQSSD